MTYHTDPHIRFFTRMLRHVINDPHIETTISWGVELNSYHFNIATSHGTLAFTLDGFGSSREWPPPIEVFEAAVTKFTQLYPELLV